MLLMFEKGIRGGFSGVLGDRYQKFNNKDTNCDFDDGITKVNDLDVKKATAYGYGSDFELVENIRVNLIKKIEQLKV